MLTSLHHLIDLEWMFEAYRLTRKDGAPGIDGMTAAEYEANLEVNLDDLLDAHQIRPLHRAAGATALHPESGRDETAAGHPDAGRQGGAAGDPAAVGADLRNGLPALLVRLPTGTVGP